MLILFHPVVNPEHEFVPTHVLEEPFVSGLSEFLPKPMLLVPVTVELPEPLPIKKLELTPIFALPDRVVAAVYTGTCPANEDLIVPDALAPPDIPSEEVETHVFVVPFVWRTYPFVNVVDAS